MNTTNITKDLLVALKTAYLAKNKYAYCKINNFILDILWILYKEGLIAEYKIKSDINKVEIKLKYINDKPLLTEFKLLSTPSLKKFSNFNSSKSYLKKFDYFFLTTSNGILSSKIILNNIKIGGQMLFGLKIYK